MTAMSIRLNKDQNSHSRWDPAIVIPVNEVILFPLRDAL
jgi:hypothetical protein